MPITQIHTNSIANYLTSHILYDASSSNIEVMCINHAYYGVSYPSYQVSMVKCFDAFVFIIYAVYKNCAYLACVYCALIIISVIYNLIKVCDV